MILRGRLGIGKGTHSPWASLALLLLCFSLAPEKVLQAAQLLPGDSPIGFFTNVAARLLRSELNLDLNQIQVYPTNQYTPAAHRLLQVAANLYDCTTNRIFLNATSPPYCPTLFRPLFRKTYDGTNLVLWIVGYREVFGTAMAAPAAAPAMISVSDAAASPSLIPSLGVAPFPTDRQEPMITGVPVIVAARKGFPNFNEFSMQTYISVSRLLEFRRSQLNGPVTATNQMYTLALTNTFGSEAWNSYSNPYPRNLQLLASIQVTALLTNYTDSGDAFTLLSNRVSLGISTNITAGSWSGWSNLSQLSSSFLLPFGNTNLFVFTNASYVDQPPSLVPLTHLFVQTGQFSVPRFWLGLNVRLLFILVDVDASRIIDYVNLDDWEPPVDITGSLATGADCSGSPSSLSNPMSLWCTNRAGGAIGSSIPTLGVLNQIAVGLGAGNASLKGVVLDPYSGLDGESAIDSFRYNLMGWNPIFFKDLGVQFYRSNVFYAPLAPYTPLYFHTTLQANDPLVHYLAADLALSTASSTNLTFVTFNPPLPNLAQINDRYEPWGGNPFHSSSSSGVGLYQIAAKDPGIGRPDTWQFPEGQPLSAEWLGQVHRGTPWQTLFLKSTNVLQQTGLPAQDLLAWQRWTGNALLHPDWSGGSGLVADALWTAPTNDWSIVSRLAPLLNTNDVRALASVNQASPGAWSSLLDGLTVLTNSASGELDPLLISSNSPAAQELGQALDTTRTLQPNGRFGGLGDILATPELTIASPWVNPVVGVDDSALEIIPAQLLQRLRPDSWGTVQPLNSTNQLEVKFSGFDDYTYTLESSTNLVDWTPLGTYTPVNGSFTFSAGSAASPQFYRSVLVP